MLPGHHIGHTTSHRAPARWRAPGAAVLLSACGRLGFGDVTGDAAGPGAPSPCVTVTGHDDDGDGLDDGCDPCPLRAGDAADADGDGVGDACDPLALATERLALFDPFLARQPEWIFDSREQYIPDQLRLAGIGTAISARQVKPPGREVFEIRGHVNAVGPGDHAVSLQIGDLGGPRHYFCDLVLLAGELLLSFVYTLDGVTYTPIEFLPVGGVLDGNDVRLTLAHLAPSVTCTATVGLATVTVSGAIPPSIEAKAVFVSAVDLDVDLEGFSRIESLLTARPAVP